MINLYCYLSCLCLTVNWWHKCCWTVLVGLCNEGLGAILKYQYLSPVTVRQTTVRSFKISPLKFFFFSSSPTFCHTSWGFGGGPLFPVFGTRDATVWTGRVCACVCMVVQYQCFYCPKISSACVNGLRYHCRSAHKHTHTNTNTHKCSRESKNEGKKERHKKTDTTKDTKASFCLIHQQ